MTRSHTLCYELRPRRLREVMVVDLKELVGLVDRHIEGHQRAGTPYNLAGASALSSLRDELQNVVPRMQNRKNEMTLPRTGN